MELTKLLAAVHDTDSGFALYARTCDSLQVIGSVPAVKLSISFFRLPTIENSLPTEHCASYSVYPADSSGRLLCARSSPSTLCLPGSRAKRLMTNRCLTSTLFQFPSDLISTRCKYRWMRLGWCHSAVAAAPVVFVDVARHRWPTWPYSWPQTFRRGSSLWNEIKSNVNPQNIGNQNSSKSD